MIGVIIVTYKSAPVIVGCLDSLLASEGADLRIVICDNASPDDSVATVRAWAETNGVSIHETADPDTQGPDTMVTLIHAPVNGGFAAGINHGLRYALEDPRCDLFWLLNPDCEVAPGTAAALARRAEATGPFALMGCRILYREAPCLIQSDGGRIRRWSGICENINRGADPAHVAPPPTESLDYISGASVVASRRFVDAVGPMPEDYFLYYEEVDWAARRGDLPLVMCDDAVVHHHGGTAIGSGAVNRRASPLSLYFTYRNRLRYLRRHRPLILPMAYVAALARIAKLPAQGAWGEAKAAFLGLHQMPPPRSVRDTVSPEARPYAFGSAKANPGRTGTDRADDMLSH
ncbi:glycosyltransferase family 2 protein [Roseospira navarrensis]|uniref:Glycosyltransferase n=1 Tax=Roseospira navarrensis TaxID=140058 RepID=A0A7X2D6N2_9PROT|nr:glycosyltransferase family 2 protein [Roseospira navarrensis]MQX38425.1 glycosyltransferase [Roseospira navarrensis]